MFDSRRARLQAAFKVARWLLVAPGVVSVWACHAPTLERPFERSTASNRQVFQEAATHKLDILFMIDNSSSMDTAQTNLRDNFPALMDVLKTIPGGMPDVHIGVVTSDLGAGGDIDTCSGDGDGGRLKATPGVGCVDTQLSPGARFISDTGGANPQRNFSGELTDVFRCIATVGSKGCGIEHQLASVARALGADGSPPPAENQGFLRDDAYLAIVLVTNEDDCSAPASTPIFDASATLSSTYGPPGNFVCNEWGHLCSRDGGPLTRPSRLAPNNSTADRVVYSPAGGPDSCVSAEGQGLLSSVGRGGYADAIKGLKRDPANQILVAAIAGPTTPYVVGWEPSPGDTGPWPVVQHACGSQSDPAGYADPGIRIAQFVREFGSNGLFYPFCSTSYGPALQTIAERLAVLIRPKCLDGAIATRPGSAVPDCTVTEAVAVGREVRQTVVPACADNGHAPPCWTLLEGGADDAGAGGACPIGTHVVSVDRGGAAPAQDLRQVVECSRCLAGVARDPSQTCLP